MYSNGNVHFISVSRCSNCILLLGLLYCLWERNSIHVVLLDAFSGRLSGPKIASVKIVLSILMLPLFYITLAGDFRVRSDSVTGTLLLSLG